MLEVTLGPGMLSKNYDGLQNDLDKMDGVFLKRGQYTYPLDKERIWHFVPMVKAGDKVVASAWLGQVDENFQPLKIMAPFTMNGTATVKTIMPEGDYKIEDTIAILTEKHPWTEGGCRSRIYRTHARGDLGSGYVIEELRWSAKRP